MAKKKEPDDALLLLLLAFCLDGLVDLMAYSGGLGLLGESDDAVLLGLVRGWLEELVQGVVFRLGFAYWGHDGGGTRGQ